MKKVFVLAALVSCISLFYVPSARAEGTRIGGGLHYWRTVNDIDLSDIDDNGVAWMISLQQTLAPLLKVEANFEIFPSGFAGTGDTVYAPQAFALLGRQVYAGAGVGAFFTDGEFADDPFFVLRAGVDLEVLPGLFLDINANYHFTNFNTVEDTVEDIDFDTITLGALLRISL